VRPDELERRLRARLDALGPAPRTELLHVLMLPDFEQYTNDNLTPFSLSPESIRLWEKHTREYVETRSASGKSISADSARSA
jgi:hypothetical protein